MSDRDQLRRAHREVSKMNDELEQACLEYDVADWARNTCWPAAVNRWIYDIGQKALDG